jgi:hypothetical protein
MRIKFKETPKQVELVKAMASKNRITSEQAQYAFAELMQPVIEKVILENDVTSGLFEDMPFNENDDPSLPLDPFRNYKEDTLSIWSQEVAGGLATNYVKAPTDEIKFTTFRVDSGISYEEKFARKARLPIIAGYMTMMVQELLRKRKYNAWTTLLTALALASHKSVLATASPHVFRATTAQKFDLDELNYWFRLVRRLNVSIFGGSPTDNPFGLTDIWCSPEFVMAIRSLSYNPINTKGSNNTAGTNASGVITLPDSDRTALLNTAGTANFMGVNLHEMNELGLIGEFNTIFDAVAGSTAYYKKDDSTNSAFVGGTTEEIVVGTNGGAPFGYRPIETSDEDASKSTFQLQPDDQFTRRSGRIGSYGWYNLGHLITTTRPLSGFIW